MKNKKGLIYSYQISTKHIQKTVKIGLKGAEPKASMVLPSSLKFKAYPVSVTTRLTSRPFEESVITTGEPELASNAPSNFFT